MANSKYAYVRDFELPDRLLPGTFILLRIDGHSFRQFTEDNRFTKPNDHRGLELMDKAAVDLMGEFPDIIMAFGQSDEYSFLLRKSTTLYNRRRSKITTIMCSHFTASYIMNWSTYFPSNPLRLVPCFDARIVLYPGIREVRDYFSWRQVDTHINNLYNTAFWALVQLGGRSKKDAHATLRHTNSGQKHEMLFKEFNINYNQLPSRFRHGSVLVKEQLTNGELDASVISLEATSVTSSYASSTVNGDASEDEVTSPRVRRNHRTRQETTRLTLLHCDIIKEEFWNLRPYLLWDD